MRKHALLCAFVLLGCAQPIDSTEPADNIGQGDSDLSGLLCNDGNDCTYDVLLASGQCSHVNYTNLRECSRSEGHCNATLSPAQCCMGCMVFVGTNAVCRASCPLGMTCSSNGFCQHAGRQCEGLPDDTPCDVCDLTGVCSDGRCESIELGPPYCACESWMDCPEQEPCHAPACVNGMCQSKVIPDGNLCSGGICFNGHCAGSIN